MPETIGDWDTRRLSRYVLNMLRDTPAKLPRSQTVETSTSTEKLIVKDKIELSPQAITYLKNAIGVSASTASPWTSAGESWSFSSADSPTFVIAVPSDATTKYSVGNRIRLKQGGSYKYFIITAVATTTLTVYGGTDFTLANSAITDNDYSSDKSPLGFPTSPAKWTVTTSKAGGSPDSSQLDPADNTWYNLGSINIVVPIGAWDLGYFVISFVDRLTTDKGSIDNIVTLSTSSTSETPDRNFRCFARVRGQDANGSGVMFVGAVTFVCRRLVTMTSKTTHYLLSKQSSGTQTGGHLKFLDNPVGDEGAPTVLTAVCAYL